MSELELDGLTEAQEDASSPDMGVSWEEAERALAARNARRVPVWVNLGTKDHPIRARFVIRSLTSDEHDQIEEAGVRIDPRSRDQKVQVDSKRLKRMTLDKGIVDGPPGWNKKTGLDKICADAFLRDELAQAIEDASTLDEDTEIGFR